MDENEHMKLWMFISECQFWVILITVILSLIVISKALWNLLKRKRSNYFLFLFSIVIANITSLLIILFDIFNFSFKGTLVCKLELFVSNSAACFINWLWLCLFTQRFFILFYPMKRHSHGFFGFMQSARKLIAASAVFAIVTQSWSLVFFEERIILTDNDQLIGVCERAVGLLSDTGYKILAVAEALLTYVLPFVLTIVMDIAVLYHSTNSSFVVMSAENLRTDRSQLLKINDTVKIQSSESIKASTHRRHLAVRRCLVMATTQVLLNAPYYTLQLVDEIYELRQSSIYLYLDAILYLIYLTQFSMIYVYTNFLVSPKSKRSHAKSPLSYTNSFRSEATNSIL
ncbi:unnamed protein product [Caenorhabditis bovis]|uniref:G-protein coupled receptors family 1 profile domain-containing protein n=1 Tax=Caenorhabditis bovis TaxID=2654633 RepID=A0A8S1F9P5_9PELO|nr:unnamed protein product [Caenorhabditis bovis]